MTEIALPALPDGNHEAWGDLDPHRRGWLGRYQTDRGVRTVIAAGTIRSALIFGSERDAIDAALKALIKHLVANPRPRSTKAKTFAVAKNGRNVRTISLPSI